MEELHVVKYGTYITVPYVDVYDTFRFTEPGSCTGYKGLHTHTYFPGDECSMSLEDRYWDQKHRVEFEAEQAEYKARREARNTWWNRVKDWFHDSNDHDVWDDDEDE